MIRKVSDFYYENEGLEEAIISFAEANCKCFDTQRIKAGEFDLEYSQLHDEFKRLFECLLEEFVQNQVVPAWSRIVAIGWAYRVQANYNYYFTLLSISV